MRHVAQGFALFAALAAVPAAAQEAGATQDVSIEFVAKVGDAPFVCGQSYSGIGTPAAMVTPTDFRFYVSAVSLIDSNGNAVPVELKQDGIWQYRDVAMIDFEDGSGPCLSGNSGINTHVVGTVPQGEYQGLELEVGVPFELNHNDPALAPAPLSYSAMFWVWRTGYRFLKVDVESGMKSDMGGDKAMKGHMHHGAAPGYAVHVGSTGCEGPSPTEGPAAACAKPNRVKVHFDQFDPAGNVVVADLASLLQYSNPQYNEPDTDPGCMAAPEDSDCAGPFRALGLAFGDEPAGEQVFLKAE